MLKCVFLVAMRGCPCCALQIPPRKCHWSTASTCEGPASSAGGITPPKRGRVVLKLRFFILVWVKSQEWFMENCSLTNFNNNDTTIAKFLPLLVAKFWAIPRHWQGSVFLSILVGCWEAGWNSAGFGYKAMKVKGRETKFTGKKGQWAHW